MCRWWSDRGWISLMILSFTIRTIGALATPNWKQDKDGKACFGTQNGMAWQSDHKKLIKDLRSMYSNCTTVYGNLEIVGVTPEVLAREGLENLDFFDNIEEVAGYILISYTRLTRISFPRLRIVWGDSTYAAPTLSTDNSRLENFSVMIMSSVIEDIDLRSLRSVMEGRVGVFNTSGLCHWKVDTKETSAGATEKHVGTMDWKQVLGHDYKARNRLVIETHRNDSCFKAENRSTCSDDCDYCWGPNPEECQEIYRTGCAPQCGNGMCYNTSGMDPNFCCHQECAAGCTGPRQDQCIGCKSMRDNGICVDKCPQREVYNVKKMEYVHNPDGKFSWIRECVKECPSHLFVYKDGCVARCPEGYYAESNETHCQRCEGPCPKTCWFDKPLNSLSIFELVNCTIIDGFLEIRTDTMEGGKHWEPDGKSVTFRGLTADELEVLSGVERITHYLLVQSDTLESLKFLRNLKQIDGRKKYTERYAMHITRMDELGELGLSSLKTILDGDVYVHDNNDLCYYYTLPWKLITAPSPRGGYDFGVRNRERVACENSARTCDGLCDPDTGCWGKGPQMCFACQYFKANQTCVRDCTQFENHYPQDKICERCDDECIGCKGLGPKNCLACKNVLLDNTCVEQCPIDSHYENQTEKRCALCDTRCSECTGPSNVVGPGGCSKCRYAVVHSSAENLTYCLDDRDCPLQPNLENYYLGFATADSRLQAYSVKACIPCNAACTRCANGGVEDEKPSRCECKEWRLLSGPYAASGHCVLTKPPNTYNVSNDLIPCNDSCDECYGPEATQCVRCRQAIDYIDRQKNEFICLAACPEERPHSSKDNVCSDVDEAKQLEAKNKRALLIIIVVLAGVFLALIIVCTVLFILRRRVRSMKYLEPPDERFEMHPDAKPNLAQLRLILESQLKKGHVLGRGAFGVVFQGIWQTDEKKVAVAIKVLQHDSNESSSACEKEMLDEAGMMASMQNKYLAELIGVCVSQQLMLVTPLFPLGNLLDYVQKHRHKIGSLALLRWCTQIATGMAYLEERRLVHRDLAARNVLVQNPYHVRITDFGLAKMLEYGEEEVKICEGKMPVKWLALECVQFRRYTHKSDVWAYGVTVWEILTFGDKPYRDVQPPQIPYLLEQGVRLPQPAICSMDIYLILIKCWMVDANARCTFKELVEHFARMSKDPGRYLAIEGDALLRLPSYAPTDRLSDEQDAREAREFLRGSASSPGTPISPTFSPLLDTSTADSSAGPPFEQAGRIRPGSRQSTSSHRYASDPVKKTRVYPHLGKPAVVMESVATDVDNYLVPDSQHFSRNSSTTGGDFSTAGTSKGSMVYTPLIDGEETDVTDGGMDYYEYLQKAVSGGEDVEQADSACDNQEYMMPNNRIPSSANPRANGIFPPLLEHSDQSDRNDGPDSPRLAAEAETVV